MLRIVLENKEALTCKNVESLSCCSLDGRISASGVGARSEILIAIGQYLTVSNGLAINVGTTAVQYGDCACFLYWLKPLTLIFLLNWLCALYTIRMCRLSARCRAVQRQADACISKQKFSVPVPPPPPPNKAFHLFELDDFVSELSGKQKTLICSSTGHSKHVCIGTSFTHSNTLER